MMIRMTNMLPRSEVSRALSSLDQEVLRSGRTVCQITTYNPTTSKAADISAVQNCFACLAKLDNVELTITIEVKNIFGNQKCWGRPWR